MFDRIAQWQPDRGAAVAARAVGALALVALAVIHVVDLPGTLGPDRLVGIGYLGIIAAAVLIGGVLLARPHRLAWAAAAAVAVSAMGGYVLTRALPGGFLGDHGDVGNWHCPLGIAALSVESVIILLVLLVAAGAWQARIHAASVARRAGLPRGARPSTASPDDHALAARPRQTPLDPRPACRRAPEGALRCACPSPARPARPTRPRGGGGCSRGLSQRASWRCWPCRAAQPPARR